MAIGTLEEKLKSEQTITDFTKDNQCSECGNCCTNMLPVSDSEVNKIKKYVKKHHIKPHVLNLPLATPVFDTTCPFLKTNETKHRCMIYPVRPFICRHFICNQSEKQLVNNLSDKAAFELRPIRNIKSLIFDK